ncbi:hypothetical protein COCON_G00142090 [Conger conger]|uniref:Neurofascin n=1 Tax=Conger conger TaxID=82655 RepID=A0A9Q1DBH7_CONCO|nr:hypothetical protein COCON_G00142090 [Conger conger]
MGPIRPEMAPQGWGLVLAEFGLLLLLWQDAFTMEVPPDLKQPPTITKQSMKEHLVDPKKGIFIECEGKGNPFPVFSWLRNGKFYNVPRDSWVSMRRWSGTLDMAIGHGRRSEEYEAEYQCFATNDYGSAVSDKIQLRISKAPLWPKEVLEPVSVYMGFPLVLPCDPPGLPLPQTFWLNSSMMPIPQDRRLSMGANGDLYFAHVTINDSLTDYCCNARFKSTQSIQQKSPYSLKVLTTRMVAETVPSFLKPSGTSSLVVVRRGEELVLECIPAGFPTPVVRWYKNGGDVPPRRVKLENFNKMLRIGRTTDEDTADYTCTAVNKMDIIRHVFYVRVKVVPYWVEKPANLIVAPDENGRIVCRAQGTPKPTVQWLVNGEPIELARPNPSRQVSGDTLIFRSVQIGSSAVYQCNASNDYGYILGNAFVHILDAAPRMLGPWNQVVKAIENNRTFLHCSYFGAPVPELRWFKEGQSTILTGNQYRTLPNGTLEIRRVRSHDQGFYTCVVTSRMGRAENHVRLEVKEATQFLQSPQRLTASRGSLARLNCKAKHDISMPITVTWLKDNKPINLGWRLRKEDDHLAIPGINRGDEGKYTCIIKTELDEISASARVTVIDRPNAPTDLELSDASERTIRLSWVPGDDNHSPILGPLTAPTNVRISKTESTEATVHWTPVPQSSIMGALKEYKVYYWRHSSVLPWLSVRRNRKSQGFYGTSPRPWGVLTDLMPYSNYRMQMVVANNRYEGPPSATIEFQTMEGVPGPPEYLTVQQRHLDTIYVEWAMPPEPNGILTGYTLKYQTVNGTKGPGRLQVESLPVNVTSFSMRRPDRYTRYKFTLSALTQLGAGEELSEESPHYTTEAYSREQVDISTQGWFIGVMCAGALLVLIVLIVCFIKRSRGGKYPVREKKDLPLDSVDDKDQDGSFDYRINRVSTLPYPKREEDSRQMRGSESQASLDGRVKMQDSEDDSLVEYGDGDDGDREFNEDGSFIGQYTGRKDREDTHCIPSSEATSPMNTIYSLA